MKNLKYTSFLITLISILTLGFTACSSSDDNESTDMTYPEIKTEGITANPIDCQVYKRGEVIPVCFLFTDDTELGAYNIEIHPTSTTTPTVLPPWSVPWRLRNKSANRGFSTKTTPFRPDSATSHRGWTSPFPTILTPATTISWSV